MSVNLTIKYVYGGSGDDSKGPVHQIPQNALSRYLKSHGTPDILKYQDIVELLKLDGAQFYPNSIRYYDPSSETYFKMEKDFTFEIYSGSSWPSVLRLWIKDANFVLRSRMTELSHRVRQLEQLRNTFPQLSETIAISNPTRQHSRTPVINLASPQFDKIQRTQSFTYPLSFEESALKTSNHIEDHGHMLALGSFSSYQFNTPAFPLPSSLALDIAIMYAEPLARSDGRMAYSLPDAVNYEEECNKIYETLESKELKIHLAIEIASRENLIKVLSRNPVILHILCHGEYDKTRKKFYLCFENAQGELDPFYADDLRTILSKCETNIKLVFVNACHSEPVASVFAEAGVPCVIAVQSQLQITDFIARKFANEFYHFIFDGHTIGDSFEKALLASRSKESSSCCCAHQHKPDCKWHKVALQEDYSSAHIFHEPLCVDCPGKFEHIHKLECPWACDFMDKFGPREWHKELKHEEDFKSCCCSPELPHDEVLKFKKISQDLGLSDKLVLYQPLEHGKILFKKEGSIIEKKFPVERLIGRNRQMYDLFTILRGPQRFVQIVGKTGVGKTVLAKQIANYLHARNYFRNKIAIINMAKFYSLSSFLSELYSEEEYVNDLKGFCEAMKSKDALFILDECDSFNTNQKELFAQLNQIVQLTRNVKFIFILDQPGNADLKACAKVEVGGLYPPDAAKLLLLNTPLYKLSFKYRNIEMLKQSDLFTKCKTISPQIIWFISNSLINGRSFDKIQAELMKNLETASEDNQSNLVIEKTLRYFPLYLCNS